MADKSKPKTKPKPRVVGPFESPNPPEMGADEIAARQPRPAPVEPTTPSAEVLRKLEEERRQAQERKAMERAYNQSLTNPDYAKGGMVGSASKRADGCAQRGKTRGKYL